MVTCLDPFLTPLDTLISVTLLSLSLLGIPLNLLSLTFFTLTRDSGTPSLLYRIICTVDTLSCLTCLPVAISLANNRSPVLYSSTTFATAWDILFSYTHKMSMFLAMCMSVSRAYSIYNPFSARKRGVYVTVFVVYSIFLIIQAPVYWLFELRAVFQADGPFSYRAITALNETCVVCTGDSSESIQGAAAVDRIIIGLEVGIPPVATFISFLLVLNKLIRSDTCNSDVSQRNNRIATITVAIFTGIFLTCNMPYFINVLLETYVIVSSSGYPDMSLFCSVYMFWYSWTVTQVVATVLNASLNPVLYLCRMRDYRHWAEGVEMKWFGSQTLKRISRSLKVSVDRNRIGQV